MFIIIGCYLFAERLFEIHKVTLWYYCNWSQLIYKLIKQQFYIEIDVIEKPRWQLLIGMVNFTFQTLKRFDY